MKLTWQETLDRTYSQKMNGHQSAICKKKQEIDSRFMLVSVSQICITANKLSKSFTPTILFIFNSIFHDAVTISVSKTCLQYTQYKRIAHGCKPQKFGVPGEVHGMSED